MYQLDIIETKETRTRRKLINESPQAPAKKYKPTVTQVAEKDEECQPIDDHSSRTKQSHKVCAALVVLNPQVSLVMPNTGDLRPSLHVQKLHRTTGYKIR